MARLSIAAMVFVGAGLGETVVREKSEPQSEPSPAVPPVELTHAARISASVLSWSLGTVKPVGRFAPGEVPVAVFTSWLASVNADASPAASEIDEPIREIELMYGASAETAAAVVSSLMVMNVEGVSDEHGPSAAISAISGFVVERPGLPPVATRYTCVAPLHEYSPVMLKLPVASDVTGDVSSGVAVELSPAVPTV